MKKTSPKSRSRWLSCTAAAQGSSAKSSQAVAVEGSVAEALSIPEGLAAGTAVAIPWPELEVRPETDCHADRLAVTPTEQGVRLRCVFQPLGEEANGRALAGLHRLQHTGRAVSRGGLGDGQAVDQCVWLSGTCGQSRSSAGLGGTGKGTLIPQ